MEKETIKLRQWLIRNDSDHPQYTSKTAEYNRLCTALSFERKPVRNKKYNHNKPKVIARTYSIPLVTKKVN